ncbi:MAG: hypothetical protein KKE11_07105 [Gammaproteobacteria bacterium]|nr:hypothetical protein [Gammaproteobacteria bacterium]
MKITSGKLNKKILVAFCLLIALHIQCCYGVTRKNIECVNKSAEIVEGIIKNLENSTHLTELNLADLNLGPEAVPQILTILNNNPELEILLLNGNDFGSETSRIIATLSTMRNLRTIRIDNRDDAGLIDSSPENSNDAFALSTLNLGDSNQRSSDNHDSDSDDAKQNRERKRRLPPAQLRPAGYVSRRILSESESNNSGSGSDSERDNTPPRKRQKIVAGESQAELARVINRPIILPSESDLSEFSSEDDYVTPEYARRRNIRPTNEPIIISSDSESESESDLSEFTSEDEYVEPEFARRRERGIMQRLSRQQQLLRSLFFNLNRLGSGR